MTPDDTLTCLLSAAQTLQRHAIRCTTEHDRIDIDRAGLPAELRDAAADIAAAGPLVAARPFAVIASLVEALRPFCTVPAHGRSDDAKLRIWTEFGPYHLLEGDFRRARSALSQALALEAKKP